MESNPWMVGNLEEFLFFCCPECDEKCQSKDSFLMHAFGNHPHSKDYLKKFEETEGGGAFEETYEENVNVKQELIEEEFEFEEDFEEGDYNEETSSEMVETWTSSSAEDHISKETCEGCENAFTSESLLKHISKAKACRLKYGEERLGIMLKRAKRQRQDRRRQMINMAKYGPHAIFQSICEFCKKSTPKCGILKHIAKSKPCKEHYGSRFEEMKHEMIKERSRTRCRKLKQFKPYA